MERGRPVGRPLALRVEGGEWGVRGRGSAALAYARAYEGAGGVIQPEQC